ncbi:MAG: S-layer homology domain-containing protein [Candidatus Peribacteraceae bacterium]|nr:S-layer homology domain-containing protein [Candidatus Peribacteraceae bacterium]
MSATALSLYWRGGDNSSSQFENPSNWLTSWPGGPVDTEGPVGGDDTVRFMDSHSGATLAGKNVWIKSNANVNGVVIHQNMTGTILLGTGALTVGWNGVRMGNGTLIGGRSTDSVAVRGGFTQTGGTVRMGGTLTVSGSFVVTGASTAFTSTGTVVLDGGNQNLNAQYRASFKNFTAASTGTITLLSDVSAITGILQINTGATVALDSYNIFATGATFINYGTLTEGTGMLRHSSSTVKITNSAYTETSSFTTGDAVYFTVTDSDENIDGTAADTLAVTVTLGSGDSETVTLTETSKTSGVFRGSILSATQLNEAAIVQDNGYLETASNTTISLRYTDAQDSVDTDSDSAGLVLASSSTTATSTSGQSGGGRRGGGGGSTVTSGTTGATQASGESAAEGGALPEVRGNLAVVINGKTVVMRDVPVTQWYAPFVLALVQSGVINGYRDAAGNPTGEFKPGNSVTYAEIAKMAVEAAGLAPLNKTPDTRSARGQWSAGYIAALEDVGVSVFTSPSLNVNAPAPRGAVLQIILETYGQTIPDARGGVYSDVATDIPHAGAIESATEAGIVSGDDGRSTFRPNAPINRAETSKIVRNAMLKLGE